MEKQWAELTPAEKRAARFKKWLSPPDIQFNSPEAEKAYKARVTRLINVIELKTLPDRVPVILPMGFLPAFYSGSSLQAVMYDSSELVRAWRKAIQDFEMDVFDAPVTIFSAKAYERLDYKLYKWPGHGLPSDSSSFQYIEGEYMKANEWDAFLNNPTEYWQRVLMPRTSGALEPLGKLPAWSPQGVLPMGYVMTLGRPEVQAAFQAMFEAGKMASEHSAAIRGIRIEAIKAGVPTLRTGFSSAPFDILGDTLRGTQGIIMDMYRQPDKIMAAIEKITPIVIESALAMANASECPIVSFPLHKGEDSFMSRKQYETFYWPSFRKVLVSLINEGVVPYVFAEGKYNTRLETIKDVPRGSMIWWFESTDMANAKRILGDTACISGNVPISILLTGTSQQVKEHCRKLIEVCAPGGGYILNGAAFMNKGDPANLLAMMEAAKEYGGY
jgi:hypothetical protein